MKTHEQIVEEWAKQNAIDLMCVPTEVELADLARRVAEEQKERDAMRISMLEREVLSAELIIETETGLPISPLDCYSTEGAALAAKP